VWKKFYDITVREEGSPLTPESDQRKWCLKEFMSANTFPALDMIEASFRLICSERMPHNIIYDITQKPEEAVSELNTRFMENGLGYEFISDGTFDGSMLFRIDSTYIHAKAVTPALALLNGAGFTGPKKEFFLAHDNYMEGRHKDAITAAGRAFEGTMRAICEKRGWEPTGVKLVKANASQLIKTVVLDENLVPSVMETHLTALSNVLTGLPNVRNSMGGHGDGAEEVPVDAYVVRYALNMAASNIVFLMEAYNALPPPPPVTALT
ncbi:MAG: hypothetical protein JWL77_1490, partial [Chthonomonadaceae bacterium]|nr:hypothetical protein [Chthonomonadaceae bacterium]